jgi:predicted transcriptional regulator
MSKRGKLEIMKDILKVVQESRNNIKPTPLLRKSGLSSASFKEYYISLLEKGLIKEILDENGDKIVILTEKGFRFLEKYKTMVSFIEEFDL